jgi:hypothetical protein
MFRPTSGRFVPSADIGRLSFAGRMARQMTTSRSWALMLGAGDARSSSSHIWAHCDHAAAKALRLL